MSNADIKVGAKIRSYDFQPLPGRGDCFMEGIVYNVSNGEISAETTRIVFAGEECDIKDEFVLPGRAKHSFRTAMPGKLYFGEWDGRVTVID